MKIEIVDNEMIEKLGSKGPFTVYAIAFGDEVKFAIQSEKFPSAPSFVNERQTRTVDRRLSRHWVLRDSKEIDVEPVAKFSMISFSEWADDPMFYSKLVNSESDAGEHWRKSKVLLDREFADPSMKAAIALESSWVQCAFCDDAFELENQEDEVITCTACGANQRLPK